MKKTTFSAWAAMTALGAAMLLLLLLPALLHTSSAAQGEPDLTAPAVNLEDLPTRAPLADGPDVIVQSIALDPPIPGAGQAFTLTVITENQGDESTSVSFANYVYLDPVDDPPNESTAETYFYYNFPMSPGGTFSHARSDDYNLTAGCDHVVYVWADKDDTVSESVESNNVFSQTVCVGIECEADAYEVDDDCASARWITNTVGIPQSHTLCPAGEEDWAKFTAIGGVTYTIEATNLGAHADPLLYLYNTCNSPSQFGDGPGIEWVAPASGVYYVRVEDNALEHGPLAGYDLVVNATGGLNDLYEPDDTCTTARDIPTDGSRQTHYFQAANDQDWVKFSVQSGETLAVVADNVGVGVNPLIFLYSSCGQAFGAHVAESEDGHVETHAPVGQTYYAKVVNQDPDTYGPEAHYDLRVEASACVMDGFEEDNSAGASRVISATGALQTHNTCPAGDEDWVHFTAQLGSVYVLETSNLGPSADTYLHLYDTDGVTELAQNDDYGYEAASRIIWQAPADGLYYAKVHHHNPDASGTDTYYDLSLTTGVCLPDAHESDNGPLGAPLLATDGQTQTHTFCGDPILSTVGDQDWARFQAVAGASYLIQTTNLGPNSDTVLELYDRDAATLLALNDDFGAGGASAISVTLPAAGTYYVRVTHYNSSYFGGGTDYQLFVTGEVAPTPTPIPTTPVPTPAPTPTPSPTEVETLILVNRERFTSLYGTAEANALVNKLYALADHERVKGSVVQVEDDAAVAAAYSAWTADQGALLSTEKANAVTSAVRNQVMAFLGNNPNVKYIVIVGDDRVIPFRRVPEGEGLSNPEYQYATSVTTDTTQWAALEDNMILTDDYYADETPTDWAGHELYVPDYAIGRLVEQPGEIVAFIDAFMSDDVTEVSQMLVTGYDFVQDGGNIINTLFDNDNITTDATLIGYSWSGAELRDKQLNASPRFDIQSINGHANHTAELTPDEDNVSASEIATASIDMAGVLIFTVGCHSGLNDAGVLDLAQAFAQQQANYVGNTGFGWGGGGVVYSEALMRNYARELLREDAAQIGPALMAAKQRYYDQAASFDAYDAKILMESILYGLPMYTVTSGGTLGPGDPFPSASITSEPPSAFGEVNVGRVSYGLSGAFGENTSGDGTFLALDDWSHFAAGEPIQPRLFADVAAPEAGALHGALFLGGVYSDTPAFDPVVALAYNEYVTHTDEPAFDVPGWYPGVPFQVRAGGSISGAGETLVTLLGQYNSDAGMERLYEQVSFDAYYSGDPDTDPPELLHVDGVLGVGEGFIKVEASDPSGVIRVVVAHTDGQGTWYSQDLAQDEAALKWKGVISATVETRYFVQAVDGAGNVALDDNKGLYHPLSSPLPLIESPINQLYLPLIMRGG
jgi:hypothetical protein